MKFDVEKGITLFATLGTVLVAISEILKQYNMILDRERRIVEELKSNKTNDYKSGTSESKS